MNTKPLVPEDRPRAAVPNHLIRAAFVLAKARFTGEDSSALASKLYRGDEATLAVVTRADATVGTTTGSGWANHLVQTALANFLGALGPLSAAATLMQGGTRLNVNTVGQVNVPIRSTAPAAPAWVAETNPIPVKQDVLAHVELGPARTLGSIVVLSREVMKRSDAANVFSMLLKEDAAKGLDGAVFSDEDGMGDAHEGLLNGATEVAGGSDLLSDLQALARSVAVGGSGQVVFVAGTGMAAAAGLDTTIAARILGSPAVAETRLIALDPLSLIWGAGDDFDISTSNEGILHMSTVPLPIVDASGTAADPTRGLWQTDAIATRLLLSVAFTKRRAAAVAYIDNVDYWS
jgi:Phage capsid family